MLEILGLVTSCVPSYSGYHGFASQYLDTYACFLSYVLQTAIIN